MTNAITGNLSNDDGDVKENGKKAIGLAWQNSGSARASRFFCTFLCRHCTTTTWKCLISRFVENANTRQQLYFSFAKLWYSLSEFNSRKNCKHLTNWTRWNKRDKVWSSATSLFKWRFRSRHRRRCLSSLMTHDTVKAKIPEMLKQELGWVTFTPVLEFINIHCIIKKQEKHTEMITLTKNTASKALHCQRKRVKEDSYTIT